MAVALKRFGETVRYRDPDGEHEGVVTAYDVVDGRIVFERNYWDNAGLLTQLGLMPGGEQ